MGFGAKNGKKAIREALGYERGLLEYLGKSGWLRAKARFTVSKSWASILRSQGSSIALGPMAIQADMGLDAYGEEQAWDNLREAWSSGLCAPLEPVFFPAAVYPWRLASCALDSARALRFARLMESCGWSRPFALFLEHEKRAGRLPGPCGGESAFGAGLHRSSWSMRCARQSFAGFLNGQVEPPSAESVELAGMALSQTLPQDWADEYGGNENDIELLSGAFYELARVWEKNPGAWGQAMERLAKAAGNPPWMEALEKMLFLDKLRRGEQSAAAGRKLKDWMRALGEADSLLQQNGQSPEGREGERGRQRGRL